MCGALVGENYRRVPSVVQPFSHVVEGILKSCEEEEIKLFVGLARKVWFRRNEVVHGGSFTHPNVLVQQAMVSMADFCSAQYVDVPSNKRREE